MACDVVGEAGAEQSQEFAFGGGEAGPGVFEAGGAEGDSGAPRLLEEVEQGGEDAGFGDVQGTLAVVGRVDGDQGLRAVDDQALRDRGGGADLAALAQQPVRVGADVGLVAGGVLVEGAVVVPQPAPPTR
ncbi:hypothetical protein [Streptomyces sp. NPDC127112]|uniref:hypothetical protein n=1 Tax=Streptomyces sp. NPDC127112 TaxID=3345364 RepID=UPI00363D0160